MNYRSILGRSPAVGFRDALLRGIAPDGSLYVPDHIPHLPTSTLNRLGSLPLDQIGQEIVSPYIDEVPPVDLLEVVRKSWTFPIPLVQLERSLYLLELFHGPTLAFKDIGARFMAHLLSYFLGKEERAIAIIVATSGDTGSAVAHGFFNVPHVQVYILYPAGKISKLQEQQMTTLGGNVRAVEVDGTFDDCQQMVKQALADRELVHTRNLTTANSINVGRLIPQIAYYGWAIAQLRNLLTKEGAGFGQPKSPIFVVPSGNFGNLTAAVYSKWMGVPIARFIAATNANDVVPEYFRSGTLKARPSLQTFSNAMDVGNPGNFARLQALYAFDLDRMRRDLDAMSISDKETLEEIRRTYDATGYVLDPHTAVGVAAARRGKQSAGAPLPFIVAATAHPGKFPDVIERALGKRPELPRVLQQALGRPKQSIRIPPVYEDLALLLRS
jgi:threonine synthase